ncbi:MAG: hypothetical protein NC906_06670 [Candidatus Omnitrophica bacterium]|nr:hypothetical protein [Candidatus Omnitrophota bacterium]MCM8816271.1 hypothetical protein [Candidatus Omnitrophota bacterium]
MFFKKKPKFKPGDIVHHRNTFERGKILRQDALDPGKWVVEWKTSVSSHPESELMTQEEFIASEIDRKTKI